MDSRAMNLYDRDYIRFRRYEGEGSDSKGIHEPRAELESIRLGLGVFRFSFPRPAEITIGLLCFIAILLGWRAAAYLAHAAHYALTGTALLPDGYNRSVTTIGALVIVISWMSIISAFLLAAAMVAHVSRRMHFRLNVRGLSVATGAISLWLLGAAFLVYWVLVINLPSAVAWFGGLASGIIGFCLLGEGARQFAKARRHMALVADEVLRTDPRPGILYLRSFILDDETAPGTPADPKTTFNLLTDHVFLPGFWLNRRSLSFEEFLCKGMGRLAPVIAIGKPGEVLPRLGAARKYVADSQWHSEVLRLIDVARFTCLVVGNSKGLQWECEQVMRQEDPQKVLLVVRPGDSDSIPRLWQCVLRKVGDNIREPILPEAIPNDTLAVMFRLDWTPVAITGRPTVSNYRTIASLMIQHTKPILTS